MGYILLRAKPYIYAGHHSIIYLTRETTDWVESFDEYYCRYKPLPLLRHKARPVPRANFPRAVINYITELRS